MTKNVCRLLFVVCVFVVGSVAGGQIWAQDAIPVQDDDDHQTHPPSLCSPSLIFL
jgi:hypothetical protein